MNGGKKILTDETIAAYKKRFEKMQKYKFGEKGDKIFITKMVAVSEQINNLHVRAKINDFIIDSDGPEELGGTIKGPGPMPALLASITNCLEITALLYLSFSNVQINSIKVKVEGTFDKRSALESKDAPLPGFYNINYTWYVDTEENLKKIDRILEKVESVCPVKGTLMRSHDFSREIVLISDKK